MNVTLKEAETYLDGRSIGVLFQRAALNGMKLRRDNPTSMNSFDAEVHPDVYEIQFSIFQALQRPEWQDIEDQSWSEQVGLLAHALIRALHDSEYKDSLFFMDPASADLQLPHLSLDLFKQGGLPIETIIPHVLGALGDLMNFADIGAGVIRPGQMNGHGKNHAERTAIKGLDIMELINSTVKKIPDKDMRAVLLALLLHDLGKMVGFGFKSIQIEPGKEIGHEVGSVLAVREIFGDEWDPENEFCHLAESLILLHPTSDEMLETLKKRATEKEKAFARLLSIMVMSDETQLVGRLTRESESRAKSYRKDPWVRIAKHVLRSQINYRQRDNIMLWEIDTDDAAKVLSENGIRESLLESFIHRIFGPKREMFKECARALFNEQTKLAIVFNNQFYKLDDLVGKFPVQ